MLAGGLDGAGVGAAAGAARTEGAQAEDVMTDTITIDGLYELREKLAESEMGDLYRARLDPEQFDYALLLAYAKAKGTHRERLGYAERVAESGETVSYEEAAPHLTRVEVPFPETEITLALSRSGVDMDAFVAQWRPLTGLSHPHLAKVFACGRHRGRGYAVLEPMRSLVGLSQAAETFTLRQRVEVGLQLARGLEALHGHGLVHRNVLPGTIAVCEYADGRYCTKLLGLAATRDVNAQLGGDVLRRLCYLAPELLRGEVGDEARADIYGLGVVLYRLLCGTSPYSEKKTLFELFEAVRVHEGPVDIRDRLPRLPAALADIVRAGLAPAEQRYVAAAEAAQDLETYLKHENADLLATVAMNDLNGSASAAADADYNCAPPAPAIVPAPAESAPATPAPAQAPSPAPTPVALASGLPLWLNVALIVMALVLGVVAFFSMSGYGKMQNQMQTLLRADAMRDGMAALRREEYELAKSAFERARDLRDDEEVRKLLAGIEERMRQKDSAATVIARGHALLRKQDFDGAREAFAEALEMTDGESVEAAEGLRAVARSRLRAAVAGAQELGREKRWEEAERAFEAARRLEGGAEDEAVAAGLVEARQGRFRQQVGQGRDLLARKKYDEAVTVFARALAIPGHADDYAAKTLLDEARKGALAAGLNEAEALRHAERWAEAEQRYAALLKIPGHEDHPGLREKLNEARAQREKVERKQNYDKAMAAGREALKEGRWEQAGRAFARALAVTGYADDPDARSGLKAAQRRDAEFFARVADAQSRRKAFDKAMARGRDHLQAGRWDEAEAAFNRALKIRGYARDAGALEGRTFAQAGRANEAEREAAYAAAMAEGRRLLQEKKWQQADQAFLRALNVEGYADDAEARNGRARAERGREAASRETTYNMALAEAQKQMDAGAWEEAAAAYQMALNIEGYTRDETALAGLKRARAKHFGQALAEGRKHLAAKELNRADQAFVIALSVSGYEENPDALAGREAVKQAWQHVESDAQYRASMGNGEELLANGIYEEAIAAYGEALASKPGDVRALTRRGLAYARTGELAKAAADWTNAANAAEKPEGAVAAHAMLGDMYLYEPGDTADADVYDEEKAFAHYEKAAQAGHPGAMNAVGVCFALGRGVKRDTNAAEAWWRDAAKKGFAPAQFNLGLMRENPGGFRRDYKGAKPWYEQAAKNGYPGAYLRLAKIYGHGRGVRADKELAEALTAKAAGWNGKDDEYALPLALFMPDTPYLALAQGDEQPRERTGETTPANAEDAATEKKTDAEVFVWNDDLSVEEVLKSGKEAEDENGKATDEKTGDTGTAETVKKSPPASEAGKDKVEDARAHYAAAMDEAGKAADATDWAAAVAAYRRALAVEGFARDEAALNGLQAAEMAKAEAERLAAEAERKRLEGQRRTEEEKRAEEEMRAQERRRDFQIALGEGKQLLAAQRWIEAGRAFDRALSIPGYEENAEALKGRATAEEHARILVEMRKGRKAKFDAAVAAGMTLLEAGSWEQAAAAFTRALAVEGYARDKEALEGRRAAQEGILRDLTLRIQNAPEDAELLNRRGMAHARLGRFAKAKADYAAAIELEGDAETTALACNNLANILAHVEKDHAGALKLYARAAESGNTAAMNSLGVCYERGRGVKRDMKQAIDWYEQAAEGGNPFAQLNLGLIYEFGRGVKKDYEKALNWYRSAADSGFGRAYARLALMYENGHGVDPDPAKAAILREQAHKRGYTVDG